MPRCSSRRLNYCDRLAQNSSLFKFQSTAAEVWNVKTFVILFCQLCLQYVRLHGLSWCTWLSQWICRRHKAAVIKWHLRITTHSDCLTEQTLCVVTSPVLRKRNDTWELEWPLTVRKRSGTEVCEVRNCCSGIFGPVSSYITRAAFPLQTSPVPHYHPPTPTWRAKASPCSRV
jgi:hypothetical protein